MEHGDGDKLLEPIQSENVRRDNKGRVVKGSRLNPSGLDRRKAKMLRDLESLTPRAIAALGRLMEGDNPAAALGAAKEVLDRNLGKVKQTVSVDVTQTHVLHLQALEELAQVAGRGSTVGSCSVVRLAGRIKHRQEHRPSECQGRFCP